jgi:hypothetical protein
VEARDLSVGKDERLSRVAPNRDGLRTNLDAFSLSRAFDSHKVMPQDLGCWGCVEGPSGTDEDRTVEFVVLVW